jgi:hypothetical protein
MTGIMWDADLQEFDQSGADTGIVRAIAKPSHRRVRSGRRRTLAYIAAERQRARASLALG